MKSAHKDPNVILVPAFERSERKLNVFLEAK